MTANHLLEAGDLILYENAVLTKLLLIEKVYKTTETVKTPEGIVFILDRRTDGNIAKLPKGGNNPFAIQTVIPKAGGVSPVVATSPEHYNPFFTYSTNLIAIQFERLLWIIRTFIVRAAFLKSTVKPAKLN